jgi:hypothetical protein
VSFYSDRIRDAFRDAGESIGGAGQQLADWLRKPRGSEEEAGADGSEREAGAAE